MIKDQRTTSDAEPAPRAAHPDAAQADCATPGKTDVYDARLHSMEVQMRSKRVRTMIVLELVVAVVIIAVVIVAALLFTQGA